MPRRLALLVATYRYQDTGLGQLTAPGHDAEALAAVLRDPEIANFDVTILVNEPHYVVGDAIGTFYRNRRRDDVTLLYFTGHGLKDDDGQLYLAMTNTRRDDLLFTALSAQQIDAAMESCSSRQKVLMLDCCYSGAFPAGRVSKGDGQVHTLEKFQGKGRVVLTASDATQYSFEGNDVVGEGTRSVFTRYLVEGLATGQADLNGDGDVSIDELYSYVHDHVVEEMPQQRPKKQENIEGRIVIARNINWSLPASVRNAIDSPFARDRVSVLETLAHLHRIGNDTVQAEVIQQIQRLIKDDSKVVSEAATTLITAITSGTAPQGALEPAGQKALVRVSSEARHGRDEEKDKRRVITAPARSMPVAQQSPRKASSGMAPAGAGLPAPSVRTDDRRRRLILIVAGVLVALTLVITLVVLAVPRRSPSGPIAVSSPAPLSTAPPPAAPAAAPPPAVAPPSAASAAASPSAAPPPAAPVAAPPPAAPPPAALAAAPEAAIPAVGGTIAVGKTPGFVAVSPQGRYAYVANRDTQVITVVDTTVNKVTATIPITEGPPQFLAFSPYGLKLYVTIYNDQGTIHTIDAIDTASNTVVAVIPQPARPFLPAATPDGKFLYVPNHDMASVSVISTVNSSVVAQIGVPPDPHWVAFSVDGSRAYTANHESNVVSVIDTATRKVVATIPVGASPHSIAVNPMLPLAASVNFADNSVSMIDTGTLKVIATVPVGKNPREIVWALDGRFAYVVNQDSDSVSVIDARTRQVTATLPTGKSPSSIAVLRNGRQAYVSNLGSGTLTVLPLTG